MSHLRFGAGIAGVLGFVTACVAEQAGAPGGRLELAVAPLSLPGAGRVCYDVAVVNGADEPVWSRGDPAKTVAEEDTRALCSDQYGNGGGGDISYVGACDASEETHTVTLWVDTIEDEGGQALFDWRDPCPDGCTLEAECADNEDTPVVFNLVVMRAANQGFFDVAVSFEDVFCSAKLDCTYDDAGTQPIELLYAPGGGERVQTAVLGLACTGGPGDDGTELHVNDVRVECAGGPPPAALIASLAIVTGSHGDAFGFDVVVDPSLPNTSKLKLTPRHWAKTGDGSWAESVQLPMVPGRDSAQVVYHLDDDHLFGPAFDADRFGPGSSRAYAGEKLAVWKRDAQDAWSLGKVGDVTDSLLGDGGTLTGVPVYDAPIDRAFLASTSGGIAGYWDVEGDAGPIALELPSGTHTGCQGRDALGDIVIARCDEGLVAWHLGLGRVGTDLALPFLPDDSFYVAELSVAGSNVLALLGNHDTGARYVVRWDGGNDFLAQIVDTAEEGAPERHWSRDELFYVEDDQAELMRYSGVGLDRWSTATLDGAPLAEGASWHLAGFAVAPGGARVVYGHVFDGAFERPVAGKLPASGQPIPLVSLPVPAGGSGNVRATFDFGVRGSHLVLYGNDNPDQQRQRVHELFWLVDAFGTLIVSDWRALAGPFGPEGLPEVEHNRREGRTVSTMAQPVGNVSRSWDIFADGEPGDIAPSAPLTRAPLGGGGVVATDVSLDPTVAGNGWTTDPIPGDAVLQYAIYRGAEALMCGALPCDKLYWNAAIAFDATRPSCTVSFQASASDAGTFEEGGLTPHDTTYPFLSYRVQLTDAGGNMVCRRNALDADDDPETGVSSLYTGLDEQVQFCHHFDGVSVQSVDGCGQNR